MIDAVPGRGPEAVWASEARKPSSGPPRRRASVAFADQAAQPADEGMPFLRRRSSHEDRRPLGHPSGARRLIARSGLGGCRGPSARRHSEQSRGLVDPLIRDGGGRDRRRTQDRGDRIDERELLLEPLGGERFLPRRQYGKAQLGGLEHGLDLGAQAAQTHGGALRQTGQPLAQFFDTGSACIKEFGAVDQERRRRRQRHLVESELEILGASASSRPSRARIKVSPRSSR